MSEDTYTVGQELWCVGSDSFVVGGCDLEKPMRVVVEQIETKKDGILYTVCEKGHGNFRTNPTNLSADYGTMLARLRDLKFDEMVRIRQRQVEYTNKCEKELSKLQEEIYKLEQMEKKGKSQ